MKKRFVLGGMLLAAVLVAAGLTTPAAAATRRVYTGAYVGCATTCNLAARWRTVNAQLGPLTYSRTIDPLGSTLPAVGHERWRQDSAPRKFYSLKPPHGDVAGLTAGRYDRQLSAIIRHLPAGTAFTVWHEPEPYMSGCTYRDMEKHVHTLVHRLRSDVQVWYVAIGWQWWKDTKGHVYSSLHCWQQAARIVDRVGIDVYSARYDYHTLASNPEFTRWWKDLVVPSGKTNYGWGVVERGITNVHGDRSGMLAADWKTFTNRHGCLFEYWDQAGTKWELTGSAERAQLRAMSAEAAR